MSNIVNNKLVVYGRPKSLRKVVAVIDALLKGFENTGWDTASEFVSIRFSTDDLEIAPEIVAEASQQFPEIGFRLTWCDYEKSSYRIGIINFLKGNPVSEKYPDWKSKDGIAVRNDFDMLEVD